MIRSTMIKLMIDRIRDLLYSRKKECMHAHSIPRVQFISPLTARTPSFKLAFLWGAANGFKKNE